MSTETTRPGICPRCGTPVTRSFKFCPACACRLQASALPPLETPRSNGTWLRALVLLVFGLLVVAVIATGFLVFRPPPAPVAATPRAEVPRPLDAPLRVDDSLLHNMVPLDRQPARKETLKFGGRTAEFLVLVDHMRILRYEVTRGMYAEYVRDCQEHPEHIPDLLQELWNPPTTLPVEPTPLPIPKGSSEAEKEQIEDLNDRAESEYQQARALIEQRQYAAARYIDTWWERLAAHVKETQDRVVEKPIDLRRLRMAPSPAWQKRLLVPPTWIQATIFEEYDDWSLPKEQGEIPENYPVTNVSWYDAAAFAEWATKKLGLEEDEAFRLPTWIEWMRAGRGGLVGQDGQPNYHYPWGTEPLVYACNNLNFWRGVSGTGLLQVDYRYSEGGGGQTPEHLWAMSGNAWEWTGNVYDTYEPVGADPKAGIPPKYLRAIPVLDPLRVQRAAIMGGSYRESIGDCRVDLESQEFHSKWERFEDVGFRLYLPGYGSSSPLLDR
jgi:formylglycine-generating enzyme required for sulfatase activity